MFKFISKENIHIFFKILTLSECAFCYRNQEHLKCNGILYYKLSLKYYKSSPLLALRLQHMGKHTPLSLLTPQDSISHSRVV